MTRAFQIRYVDLDTSAAQREFASFDRVIGSIAAVNGCHVPLEAVRTRGRRESIGTMKRPTFY
jgi:hypothetical protein